VPPLHEVSAVLHASILPPHTGSFNRQRDSPTDFWMSKAPVISKAVMLLPLFALMACTSAPLAPPASADARTRAQRHSVSNLYG
jgi:hypothetical protein